VVQKSVESVDPFVSLCRGGEKTRCLLWLRCPAPTSNIATSTSAFGGSGGYGVGNNAIAFNLGNGLSDQSLASPEPSVYSPMGGGGVMPAFSNIPSAASSAAYFQNLSSQYTPSLFGSTTLGSAAYGLGQGEVNGAVNAWNYVSSNAPALVEHPSAFLPGIAQGGANLINSAENMALSVPNAVLSAHNYLTGDNWQPLGSDWSNNLFVPNDPAHNVEMALNTAGFTGLSFGSTAIPEMAGYVSSAGNLVDSSAIAAESEMPALNILNPEFTPYAGKVLQNATDYLNGQLAANPSLAKQVLSPAEYAAGQNSIAVARMQYGNAVERLVAEAMDDDLGNQIVQYTGGPGGGSMPDFVGVGPAQGQMFDITTPGQVASKAGKWYGPNLITPTYVRPPGFTAFP
jgi:hypothetical protein